MPRTVHVMPRGGEWTVKREGSKRDGVFRTKQAAVESAKELARTSVEGQVVVYSKDGRIQEERTYGMARIQDPPGKKSAKIEKAVDKVTRDRLEAGRDSLPPRG